MLTLIASLRDWFRTRAVLQAEIFALGHQLLVLRRSHRSLRLTPFDRLWWVWLSQPWTGWRSALLIVKSETVIAWHRMGFRLFWRWKSRHPAGRPSVSPEVETSSAEWAARQVLKAFPWDSAPRYMLRDRDGNYGEKFHAATQWLGIREILTAPRSPWQNPYVERLIGSIPRACLDHVIVISESSLRRVLKSYFEYYDYTRTHLSLEKDAPVPRLIQPAEIGRVVELPQVGGLHHRYERCAA